MQQVGDIGLPPDRHPPEVVAALAAHRAGLAPRSALSPALVRARVSARRAPQGQPGAGGCRLHAHARRDSRGATRLLRAAPSGSGGSWASLPRPFLPGARRAAQAGARSLRLPHSPGAATAAAGLGLLPASLRSPTPEALGEGRGARRAQAAGAASARVSASSSGRESCQGLAVPSGAPWARSGARSALEAPPRHRPALAHWPRAAARRSPAAAHLGPRGGCAHLRARLGRAEIITASLDSAPRLPVLTDPHDKGLPCVSTAEPSPE